MIKSNELDSSISFFSKTSPAQINPTDDELESDGDSAGSGYSVETRSFKSEYV